MEELFALLKRSDVHILPALIIREPVSCNIGPYSPADLRNVKGVRCYENHIKVTGYLYDITCGPINVAVVCDQARLPIVMSIEDEECECDVLIDESWRGIFKTEINTLTAKSNR